MKETTRAAMLPYLERWCQRFDEVFTRIAQSREFGHYLEGLLDESQRKNLTQISRNPVGVVYHRLYHFLTSAPWDADKLNERRAPSDAII